MKLEDEDKVVILLNALPKTSEHFRDALLYGKDQLITLEEVVTSIRTKEFQKLQDSKITEEVSSCLATMKGKGKKGEGKWKKSRPETKKQVRCFKCQKVGHIKKHCPEKGTKASRVIETTDVAVWLLKDMNLLGSWWLHLTIHRRVGLWTQDAHTICVL